MLGFALIWVVACAGVAGFFWLVKALTGWHYDERFGTWRRS